VVVTRDNLDTFVQRMQAEQLTHPDDVFLNVAPYSFDLSCMDTWVALASGSSVLSITRDHLAGPDRLRRRLASSDATIWVSTPSFARLCLSDPTFGASLLPKLRSMLFCGETLASDVASGLIERFPTTAVWNTYGPTETTVATTSVRVDRALLDRYPVLPIGNPMPASRVVIVDEQLRELTDGERGEILIAGPHVSPGYFGRPDLTAREFMTFDGAPAYRTGDRGRRVNGLLFFEGRADDQVKVNGYRIELGDVEANVRSVVGVQDAVVAVLERSGRPEALAVFVLPLEPIAVADVAGRELALRRTLAERLPGYMLPRYVRFVEAFPLTGNGKVDRRALIESLG